MKKTILILANSIRCGGRCVAGRELTRDTSGKWQPGAWIRPVSPVGEGELNSRNCIINVAGTDREVAPFDIVEIELIGPAPDKYQCENWALDTTVPMKWIESATRSLLNACVENPTSLWHNAGMNPRKISCEISKEVAPTANSLFLVRVNKAEFRKYVLYYGTGNSTKRLANFTYHDVLYQLPITDPMVEELFKPTPNGVSSFTKSQCLIVVSLAKPFKGMRYKIVASILEEAS